jgi:hypothetical protein
VKIFGIEIIADFRPPIVSNEDLQEYSNQFKQAKADGDTKTKYEVGNRLYDQGYRWDGEDWRPSKKG